MHHNAPEVQHVHAPVTASRHASPDEKAIIGPPA